MTLLDALSRIASMDAMVFSTSDVSARLQVRSGHASVMLARLAASGQLVSATNPAAQRRGACILCTRRDDRPTLHTPPYLIRRTTHLGSTNLLTGRSVTPG
jgi:hypothetical protein